MNSISAVNPIFCLSVFAVDECLSYKYDESSLLAELSNFIEFKRKSCFSIMIFRLSDVFFLIKPISTVSTML
jgi:hypothetical protein